MSKIKENKPKVIINGKEYNGDEITPEIIMGAIQALKLQLEADMDKRFKRMATTMNGLEGHIRLIDETVQDHVIAIEGFNQNFQALQKMIEQPKGDNNEKE